VSSLLVAVGIALSCVLLVPSAFFMIECLASRRRGRPEMIPVRAPKVAILVPAHDEAQSIENTLAELMQAVDAGMRVLVVADNCSDDTAKRAAIAGARVIERNDPSKIGKGYAIAYGVRALEHESPDVVVILDADCHIDAFSLRRIADLAYQTGKPVQAEYTMAPSSDALLSRLSAFAFAVRNRVRPRGLKRMGVPVHLAGTGMAFPFRLLRSAPNLDGHLAEDQLLGLELTLAGRAPILAEEAMVTSCLPSTAAALRRQRGRWEGGSLSILRSHLPRVLRDAIRYRRGKLVGVALDLSIPPLAMLTLFCALALGFLGIAALLGASPLFVVLGSLPLVCVAIGVGVAWSRVGRELIGLEQLACAPLYVLWKVPLYLGMALRGIPTRWERTERERIE